MLMASDTYTFSRKKHVSAGVFYFSSNKMVFKVVFDWLPWYVAMKSAYGERIVLRMVGHFTYDAMHSYVHRSKVEGFKREYRRQCHYEHNTPMVCNGADF